MAAAHTKAGSEQPLGGGAPHLPPANALRCGALRLPRVRSPRPSARSNTDARATATRVIGAAALIAFILTGGILMGSIGHHRITKVDLREPSGAGNTIEAWLRHMTITRTPPADTSPLTRPDGL